MSKVDQAISEFQKSLISKDKTFPVKMSLISIEKKDNFHLKNLVVIHALSKRLGKTQNEPYFPTALLCLATHCD